MMYSKIALLSGLMAFSAFAADNGSYSCVFENQTYVAVSPAHMRIVDSGEVKNRGIRSQGESGMGGSSVRGGYVKLSENFESTEGENLVVNFEYDYRTQIATSGGVLLKSKLTSSDSVTTSGTCIRNF